MINCSGFDEIAAFDFWVFFALIWEILSGKVEKVVIFHSYLIGRAVEFSLGQGRVRWIFLKSSSLKSIN